MTGYGKAREHYFNYDFHVTLDQDVAPVEYNYRRLSELGPEWHGWSGEMHGISAFPRRGDQVFHAYSSYARGADLGWWTHAGESAKPA